MLKMYTEGCCVYSCFAFVPLFKLLKYSKRVLPSKHARPAMRSMLYILIMPKSIPCVLYLRGHAPQHSC